MIRHYTKNDLGTLNSMFSDATRTELLYKPFTDENFESFFLGETVGAEKKFVISEESGVIQGYASGCTVPGKDTGYITYVYVKPEYRRARIGTALIAALEDELKSSRPDIVKFDILFFNPMQFSWFIPNSQGADHPCAPGVDMLSPAFIFFKNNGYRCYAYQNSYYQPLHDYEFPADIKTKIENLKQHEIEVTYYDRTKHHGLPELFDNINNPSWKAAIMANDALGDKALPLLVAVYKGELVVGYTGPLSVQKSGRGNFHGIGVHTEYRKGGAGKVLFSNLCMSLKHMGATFMSLYTGEDNPARNIYEAVGFRVVRSWADMRKIIK